MLNDVFSTVTLAGSYAKAVRIAHEKDAQNNAHNLRNQRVEDRSPTEIKSGAFLGLLRKVHVVSTLPSVWKLRGNAQKLKL